MNFLKIKFMGLFRWIFTLPFKIIAFPFKILRNIFSSENERHYRSMRGNVDRGISKIKEKTKDENLSDRERKKLEEHLKKAEKNRYNLKNWRKHARHLEHDPDDMRAFRKAKRYEKRLRKSGGA
jgi:hypothetical protein